MGNPTEALLSEVKNFRDKRDWAQFHTIKNLSQALIVEAAELNEVIQWKTEEEIQAEILDNKFKNKLSSECADVFIYLLLICDKLGVDIIEVADQKIKINEQKYPVNKSKGTAKKYTEF